MMFGAPPPPPRHERRPVDDPPQGDAATVRDARLLVLGIVFCIAVWAMVILIVIWASS